MTPDVIVLVAAFRGDHPHHAVARPWLQGALDDAAGGAGFTAMPMVIASFLRLVTSPRIFVEPSPVADAVGFIDTLLTMPGVQLAPLGAEWPKLRQLCLDRQWPATRCPMPGWPPPWNTWASIGSVSTRTFGAC